VPHDKAGYRSLTRDDYLVRTIATVRNHRGAASDWNTWVQWANIFADEIERLWDEVEGYQRALVAHHDLATLSNEVIKEYDFRECPVCRRAREGK